MQHREPLIVHVEPLYVRLMAAEKEADKRRRRLRPGVMPIIYLEMQLGEIPVYSYARSRDAHVYVPRKGWVRQEAPSRPDENDPLGMRALNAYVPLAEVPKKAFPATLKRRIRTLPRTRRNGGLTVHYHFSGDFIHFGLVHIQQVQLTEPGHLEPGRLPWPSFPRGITRNGDLIG